MTPTPLKPLSLESDEQLKADFTVAVSKCKTKAELCELFNSLGDTEILFGGKLRPASEVADAFFATMIRMNFINGITRNYGLRAKAMEILGHETPGYN